MDMREWALLIFTILGQVAAGSLFVLLIVRTYAVSKAGLGQADQLTDGPTYIVAPIMVLALLASLFHLGSPMNIVKAVPNLGTSWLSREVVIAVVFVIFAGLYTFMQYRKAGSASLRMLIGWIAGLVGLLQVYGMGMVYMIRTQPAWNNAATQVTFFTTALLLGVVTIASALVVNQSRANKSGKKAGEQLDLMRGVLQSLAMASIVLLGVEFLVTPLYMGYLSSQGTAAMETLSIMINSLGSVLALRLILVFIGAGVVAAYLYRNTAMPGKESTLSMLTYSALILVLISEVMGRFIFYATHVGIGL